MWRTSLTRASKRYGAGRWARKLPVLAVMLLAWATQAAAEVRILAFGDSLVQGYGLPEAEGFVPQLEDWLGAHGAGEVEVINAGVSGDTTAGGLARIDWALAEEPDAAIVVIGANDMLRGLPLGELRGNLDGILSAIDAEGLPILLAPVPAVSNYGAAYQAEFTGIYADLAEEYGAILHPNFFAGITSAGTRDAAMAMLQPDGIHPNAAGVRANVEQIGPLVLELLGEAKG